MQEQRLEVLRFQDRVLVLTGVQHKGLRTDTRYCEIAGGGSIMFCLLGSARLGSVRFGSVRFGSVRFGTVRFGSDRFNVLHSVQSVSRFSSQQQLEQAQRWQPLSSDCLWPVGMGVCIIGVSCCATSSMRLLVFSAVCCSRRRIFTLALPRSPLGVAAACAAASVRWGCVQAGVTSCIWWLATRWDC